MYFYLPLILVQKQLKEEIRNEFARLKAKKVVILGGEAAINREIEEQLNENGYQTERLAGLPVMKRR